MVTEERLYPAVADPIRRAILDNLRDGAKPVNEIARAFSVSRPAVSKHLRILHEAKLVSQERQGRRRIYRLNAEPLRQLDLWLAQYRRFWAINLASWKAHVESTGGPT